MTDKTTPSAAAPAPTIPLGSACVFCGEIRPNPLPANWSSYCKSEKNNFATDTAGNKLHTYYSLAVAPVAIPAPKVLPTGKLDMSEYDEAPAPLPPPQEPTLPANLLTWYGFSDLPPLPYRSGTTHQPWPNDSKIYDAKGKDVEKRNWKEGMAARGFMVMAANFVHELIKQNNRPATLAGETRTEALNKLNAEWMGQQANLDYTNWLQEKVLTAASRIAQLEREREEAVKMLKKELDREWKDEDFRSVVTIAANGIYWRNIQIETLKSDSKMAAALTQAQAEIKKLAAEMPRWRGSKPQRDGLYLIYGGFIDGGSFYQMRIAEFADGKWLRDEDELAEEDEPREMYHDYEIKYWTALPSPPREEAK